MYFSSLLVAGIYTKWSSVNDLVGVLFAVLGKEIFLQRLSDFVIVQTRLRSEQHDSNSVKYG